MTLILTHSRFIGAPDAAANHPTHEQLKSELMRTQSLLAAANFQHKKWMEYAHGLEFDVAMERGKRTACEMVIVDLKRKQHPIIKIKRKRFWIF